MPFEVVNLSFQSCSSYFVAEAVGINDLEPLFQAVKKFKKATDTTILLLKHKKDQRMHLALHY